MVRPVGSVTKSSVPDMRQDNPSAAGAAWNATLAKTQSKPKNGIFGSNAAGVPAKQQDYLHLLSRNIDSDRWSHDRNGIPERSFLNTRTILLIEMYFAGRADNKDESPSQRLANMMSVLGPERMYAVLVSTPVYVTETSKAIDLQGWLNTLIKNGQFTADDAKALALGQAEFARLDPHNFKRIVSAVGFMISAPNDQKGAAVKDAYVQGCMTGVQKLAQEIGSGKYPEHVQTDYLANLNRLYQEATNLSVSSGVSDPVKKQVFSQLRTAATQLAGAGKLGGDLNLSDVLNAYAANILGLLSDKSQVAATLRAMGGVGRNGAIDQDSDLAKFLQSALRGQSQFGIASFSNIMTPKGNTPQGVTSLLTAMSGSGNTKLMAGTLHTVMQWMIVNPTQAAVLASQDTEELYTRATGYRNALTNLLDKSFNQFVTLNPSYPNEPIVGTMHPRTVADLQALSAIQMGPPYDSGIAGHFAQVFGKHAVQFAAMAVNQAKYPELDRLLAGGGDLRISAGVIFGELMNGFAAGLNQSQASFRRNAPRDARLVAAQREMETRVISDLARAFGTGTLLASAWISPAGIAVPMGFGAAAGWEKLASIFGRVGLFSGSFGTAKLDIANASQEAETKGSTYVRELIRQAGGPTQLLQQTYDGWVSNRKLSHGRTGQEIRNGVLIGSSFAGAPMIETGLNSFYEEYDPFGYYHRKTDGFPPIR